MTEKNIKLPKTKASNVLSTNGLLVDIIQLTSFNPEELKVSLNKILGSIRNYTKADLIEIWLPSQEDDSIELFHALYNDDDIQIIEYLKESTSNNYTYTQFENTQLGQSTDIQWLQLAQQQSAMHRQVAALKCGLHTVIAIPIIVKDKKVAATYIYFKQEQPNYLFSSELLNLCAAQIAVHFEQSQTQRLIKGFLKNAVDLLCVTTYSGQLFEATHSFLQLFGIDESTKTTFNINNLKSTEPVLINKAFVLNPNNVTKEYTQTYYTGTKEIIINWSITLIAFEKLLIFYGKNVTENVYIHKEIWKKNKQLSSTKNELESIINNIDELFFKISGTGFFEDISDNVCNVLGYAKDEIIGKSIFDYVHASEIDILYGSIVTEYQSPVVIKNLRHRLKAKDGSWKWFLSNGQTIFEGIEPKYIIGLSKDITEGYLKYQNVINIAEQYKEIFATSITPNILYNSSSKVIIDSNIAAQALYGYTQQELTAITLDQLKYTGNHKLTKEYTHNIQKYSNRYKDNTHLSIHVTKQGHIFIAEVKQNQMTFDGALYIAFSIQDVTQLVKETVTIENKFHIYDFYIQNNKSSIYRYEAKEPVSINQPVGSIISQIVNNFYLTDCNDVIAKRYGFSTAAEIIGIRMKELYSIMRIDYAKGLSNFISNEYEVIGDLAEVYDVHNNTIVLSTTFKGEIINDHLVSIWGISTEIEYKDVATTLSISKRDKQILLDTLNVAVTVLVAKGNISTSAPIDEQIEQFQKHLVVDNCNQFLIDRHGIKKKEDFIGIGVVDFYSIYGIDGVQLISLFINSNYKLDNYKLKLTMTNGSVAIVQYNVSAIIEGGYVRKVYVSSKDITIEEQELTKTRTLHQTINLLPDAVYTCNEAFEVINWNNAAEYLYGMSSTQIIGKTISDFITPNYSIGDRSQVLEQLAIHGHWTGEVTFLHFSTGKPITLLSTATTYINDDKVIYIVTSKDITERKLHEQELIESEVKFQNIANNSPVMLWQTDINRKNIFYSKQLLQFTGLNLPQQQQLNWSALIHPDDRLQADSAVIQAMNNIHSYQVEYRLKHQDGTYRYIVDKGNPHYNEFGVFKGYFGVCIDIDELKTTQHKLEDSKTNFELLNKASNEAIWESDLVTHTAEWKIGYKKLFGHKHKTVTPDLWLSLVHPEDLERVKQVFLNLDPAKLRTNNVLRCEYRFLKADGNYAIVRDVAYVVLNKDGVPVRMIGAKKDITQQREIEQKLIQVEVDRQIAINKAMIEGQEKEKLELSQELHDNINQLISSSKLYMEVAKREIDSKPMIHKAIETLSIAVQEIRRLSKSLNPATVNQLKLVDAIEQLVEDIKLTGKLNIEFDYTEFTYNITLPQLNLYLYRIVQEQVNNIIKYAKTDTATISLKNNEHYLYLRISDPGVGFDVSLKSNGIGITNIMNRVALFKGIIDIQAAPNQGCTIEINIPLTVDYL